LQGCKNKATETAATGASTNSELPALTNSAYADTSTNSAASPVAANEPANAPLANTNTNPFAAPAATKEPAGSTAPVLGEKEYIVAKGDAPFTIAKAHGISTAALLKANPGLKPNKLQIGQKLVIPAPTSGATTASAANGSPAATTSASASEAAAGSELGSMHVVKGGENLTRIAKHYGVSVKALRAANSLKTDRIHSGQKLKIPAGKVVATTTASAAHGTSPATTAAR